VHTTTRWLLILAAIFALAVIPRLAVAARLDQPPRMTNDAGWYDFFGQQLAQGRGYTLPYGEATATWPPGYPLFLGGLYKVTDESRDAARFAQALLGAATAVIVAEIGRRLFSQAAGIAAGVVLALWPSHITYTSVLMSEVLFTTLVAAAILVGLRARSPVTAAATGVLFGAAVLVRPQAIVLMLAVVAAWAAFGWLRRDDWRSSLGAAAVIVAAATLTVAPWTLRNAARLDAFVPVSTNLGLNLWIGNNPDADGSFEVRGVEQFEDEVAGLHRPELEVRYDRAARDAALDYIRDHPLEALSRTPNKIYETYRNDASAAHWYEPAGADYLDDDARDRIDRVSNIYYFAMLAVAGAGAILLAVRRDGALVVPVTTLLAWTAVSLVFFGEPRFHVPVLPAFALLAGVAIAAAYRAVADHLPQRLSAPSRV
jgi:4-amino-4-deoxy-L-arabinose transferase-like glycosyltransferase